MMNKEATMGPEICRFLAKHFKFIYVKNKKIQSKQISKNVSYSNAVADINSLQLTK